MGEVSLVGGKNASLGEMIQKLSSKGIKIPEGFAITTHAYWEFLYHNRIKEELAGIISSLDKKTYHNLYETGKRARDLILGSSLPPEISERISVAYASLCDRPDTSGDVAVRSSATAEDMPTASFAGQHDSFLNIRGTVALLMTVRKCYASLFNDRAIKYREDRGIDHLKTAISVGVQKMVRSDLACSGIGFTLDPETGFRNVIHLAATWGLGENIVKGIVNPDEFIVFKPSLISGKNPIIHKKAGTKEKTLVYAGHSDHQPEVVTANVETPENKRAALSLSDEEIITLSQWGLIIENHYNRPMDFEWARDGFTNELFLLQARPETVHAAKNALVMKEYILGEKGRILATGNSVGNKIASGIARIIKSPAEFSKLNPGEIIVAETTDPDWNAVLKKAGAIITNKGGRTSHASIVARELGIAAAVGTENATQVIRDGQPVTVDCHQGKTCFVYEGLLKWKEKEINLEKIKMPRTQPLLIAGDPDKAFQLSFYPCGGIGLMRLEFIISNSIRIHPMALARFHSLQDEAAKAEIEKLTAGYSGKENFFVERLSQEVAVMAAAFYPREVIVRMSDFKTNEYANLLGGKEFEQEEENPMIGFRGASRYYHHRYRDGFRLECEAMKIVRNKMGLTNVKLMVPFCRTVEEGKKVIRLMEDFGLKRKVNHLEIYMMVEIPSNALQADEFAKIFDGFSIGSNDLTQLTLGVDRDNAVISSLFSERDPAVTSLISAAIQSARRNGIKIGLCGQAPSDDPEFARFLVSEGIDSISFNADALLKGIENMTAAENN